MTSVWQWWHEIVGGVFGCPLFLPWNKAVQLTVANRKFCRVSYRDAGFDFALRYGVVDFALRYGVVKEGGVVDVALVAEVMGVQRETRPYLPATSKYWL